jgi:hypothetical protein
MAVGLRLGPVVKLVAGLSAGLLIAMAGWLYASGKGLPLWETVVTWQEWVAAILLLPTVLLRIIVLNPKEDIHSKKAHRIVAVLHEVALVALAIFLVAVLTRATLGLGFKPF